MTPFTFMILGVTVNYRKCKLEPHKRKLVCKFKTHLINVKSNLTIFSRSGKEGEGEGETLYRYKEQSSMEFICINTHQLLVVIFFPTR